MQKRGQVTIFIILGIIILVVLAWLFFVRGDILDRITTDERADVFVSSQIEPIKELVSECTKEQLVDSIIYVSRSGGYFDPPTGVNYCDEYTSNLDDCLDPFLIAHSYDTGQNRLVTLTKLGIELNDYMSDDENFNQLKGCVNAGLDDFESKGLSTTNRDFILGVPEVGEESVYQTVTFDVPLEVRKSDYTATINEVIASVNAPLKKVQNVAADVTECYMGIDPPVDYNSYCNINGITFNSGWYNVDILQDARIHVGNLNGCSGDCVDCYFVGFNVEDFEAKFNVLLKEC